MIKGWKKFNENKTGTFDLDMAQEIVYYFSEDSHPSKTIESVFLANPEVSGLFQWYESGHEEYQAAYQKLYGMVNTGSLDFRDSMIQVYNMIREERSSFPLISEIEDSFLFMVDAGYSFLVDTNDYDYKIRMYKYDDTIENFIRYTQAVDAKSKRFNSGSVKSTLSKVERLNGFYNKLENGKDRYELNEFEVVLRRTGFQKNTRTNKWEPEE